MHRRDVLAGAVLGATVGPGCLTRSGCPDPELENGLTYQERRPGRVLELGTEGVVLVTDPGDADRLDAPADHEQWVRDTDFDDLVVLGTQVGSSGDSSELRVLGVDREDRDTVHAYTCIHRQGGTDDWQAYARLLRVPRGETPPTTARLTHWEADEKQTFADDRG